MSNIVLVGVGGAGVSSLAGMLLTLGYTNIVGINNNDSAIIQTLKKQGLKAIIGHGTYDIQPTDVVVYSAAAKDSIEVQQGFSLHEKNYKKTPPPMLFHECMGEISKYCKTLAVTGTHGKSSTSSMAAAVLEKIDDSFGVAIIGAKLVDRGNKGYAVNEQHIPSLRTIMDHIFFRKGQSIGDIMKTLWFVVEADEYNKHFLFLDTDYAIITSCELDHLDTYGTEDNYFNTFFQFVQRVKHDIIVPQGDTGIVSLEKYCAKNTKDTKAFTYADTSFYDFSYLLGGHNHSNASLVETTLEKITQEPKEDPILAIQAFRGIQRRGEFLGKNTHGVAVYSDYGHHPTELSSTLKAFRDTFENTALHVLFQPHQMARVVQFWDEFHDAMRPLSGEERAYSPIYAARETVEGIQAVFPKTGPLGETSGVKALHTVSSSDDLSMLFAKQGDAPLLENDEAVYTRIESISEGIIVFFSAGSLDKVVREYIDKIN